jgi:hypothetical protein
MVDDMELTVGWCETCSAETLHERPDGETAPEAACVQCGLAVLLAA